ncbi:MAG TPA: PA2778 family cysteine peptidase [Gammaproteobacteria bacterium]|nr:PA2778 family cysteine peptidase [Gammaproteobacteria bacterium]
MPLPTNVAPIELTGVPFFPQTEYQCGPAALATILAHEGVPVDADGLVDAVYVEGLRGSLQPELLGATRRNARIPYVLEPEPAALFAELAAGRPVLVLQNLGFERVPVWHYAVVVGFDSDSGRVILRSGTERRRLERIGRFLRSWERADNWGFVALRPGVLPATATPARYVRALASAEPWLQPSHTLAAYRTALAEWPKDELVLFAAAAREHARGDLVSAAALYRQLIALAPEHAAARNNLANVLAEQGCYDQALSEARAALESIDSGSELHAAISDTLASIEKTSAGAAAAAQCL